MGIVDRAHGRQRGRRIARGRLFARDVCQMSRADVSEEVCRTSLEIPPNGARIAAIPRPVRATSLAGLGKEAFQC